MKRLPKCLIYRQMELLIPNCPQQSNKWFLTAKPIKAEVKNPVCFGWRAVKRNRVL